VIHRRVSPERRVDSADRLDGLLHTDRMSNAPAGTDVRLEKAQWVLQTRLISSAASARPARSGRRAPDRIDLLTGLVMTSLVQSRVRAV
jgi:hypothetical protein